MLFGRWIPLLLYTLQLIWHICVFSIFFSSRKQKNRFFWNWLNFWFSTKNISLFCKICSLFLCSMYSGQNFSAPLLMNFVKCWIVRSRRSCQICWYRYFCLKSVLAPTKPSFPCADVAISQQIDSHALGSVQRFLCCPTYYCPNFDSFHGTSIRL